MKDSSIPTKPPPTDPLCCSPSAAWVWVNAIAEMALGGEIAPHVLAGACDHALKMIRAAGVPR